MPVIQSLTAARNLDFAPVLALEYSGDALTLAGATISMQVRLYPGAAGDALAEDANVGAADAATPSDDDADLRTLSLSPVLARAALAALPGQNEPEAGADQAFVFEIKIIYADTTQESLWIGDFILTPGVNDA